MTVRVNIQYAVEGLDTLPSIETFRKWAEAAVDTNESAELVIRVVDSKESEKLNRTYRDKPGPTNVLSFPFEPPPQIESCYLGDVVICASVVTREAMEQGKDEPSHWAHLVVHGILHLRGYDHQTPREALVMESREREIMTHLGYPDPYRESRR